MNTHAAGEGAEEALGLVLPAAESLSGQVFASGARWWWRTSATTAG